MSMRICAIALGLGIALTVGCDNKSGSTSSGAVSGSPAAPSKGGGGDDGYGKKLVGVWEGKEKFGDKEETMTVEFKSDGSMKMTMGPFDMKGTYKVVKEEGKTVTIDTEMSIEGFGDAKAPPKTDKKTLTATFEDANTVVLQKVGEKPDPLKLKRKT
jgi:hypothetical protein